MVLGKIILPDTQLPVVFDSDGSPCYSLFRIEHSNDEIKGNVMFCQDPAVPHC